MLAVLAVVTQLPEFPVLVARVILSTIILVLYVYDLIRVFDAWRDRHEYRRSSDLRSLVKSFNLTLGLVIILLGALSAAFFTNEPFIRDGLRFLGYVLLGTLMVGGIALCYSWYHERELDGTRHVS